MWKNFHLFLLKVLMEAFAVVVKISLLIERMLDNKCNKWLEHNG